LRATWLVGMIGALFAIGPIVLGKLKLSNLVWPFLFPEGTSHMVQCFPFEMSLFIAGALAFRAYAIIGQEWPWPPQKTGEFAFHRLMRAPMKSTIIYAISGVICAASLWYICDGGWGLTPHRIGKIRLPDAYWLVIVTLIVTIPWIFYFSRNFSWDRRLGELSYPVYLGHLLVIKFIGKYYVLTSDVVYWKVVPMTLLLAGVIWGLVERPMNAWRHRRFENRRDPSTARVDGGVPALV
jgi:peptidoglycan/LPS O-acetylase OafA/YrhL